MTEFKIPNDIEKEAKDYMKDVIQELKDKGLYNSVDNASLLMLSRNYSTFIKASKQLQKDGLCITSDRGNLAPHPCIKIQKDSEQLAMRIISDFGLTSLSRKKLTCNLEDNDTTDPLDSFLSGQIEKRDEGVS